MEPLKPHSVPEMVLALNALNNLGNQLILCRHTKDQTEVRAIGALILDHLDTLGWNPPVPFAPDHDTVLDFVKRDR